MVSRNRIRRPEFWKIENYAISQLLAPNKGKWPRWDYFSNIAARYLKLISSALRGRFYYPFHGNFQHHNTQVLRHKEQRHGALFAPFFPPPISRSIPRTFHFPDFLQLTLPPPVLFFPLILTHFNDRLWQARIDLKMAVFVRVRSEVQAAAIFMRVYANFRGNIVHCHYSSALRA